MLQKLSQHFILHLTTVSMLRAPPKTPFVISSLLNSIFLHLCLTWTCHASLQIHRLKFNNFDLTSRVFGDALKCLNPFTLNPLFRISDFFLHLFQRFFRPTSHISLKFTVFEVRKQLGHIIPCWIQFLCFDHPPVSNIKTTRCTFSQVVQIQGVQASANGAKHVKFV